MSTARPAPTILGFEDWNESVGRYCFTPRNAARRVRFAVDPIVLQRAAAEGPRRYHFPTPEAAAADFRAAVTRRIDEYGWRLGYTEAGRIPSGLAKLALQVLAVFGIAADDEVGSSYWAALFETLGRPIDRRGVMPDDLDAETHQESWAALARWANVQNKGRLGRLPTPDPNEGGRRHVRLPMSHGLLRSEDIQGLPRFFSRVNVLPGEEVEPEDIISYLRAYADDVTVFRGAHARRVLQDERLPLAADQIAIAASQWDGQRVDLTRSRGPVVRLWLAVHTAGGVRLSGGLLQLEPQGTSADVPGVVLEQLFGRGTLRQLRTPVAYQPIDGQFLVGVRSLLDGRYVEARHLRPGDEVVVVRPVTADVSRTERELRWVAAGGRVTALGKGTDGLPDGWTLYRLRVREGLSPTGVPNCLEERFKLAGVRLRAGGGLKVRGAWVEGAGPILKVKGGEAEIVVVDETEYELNDGCLHPERCPALNAVGVHEAWLPGRHRDRVRFRVIQPRPARFSMPVVDAGWARDGQAEWPGRLDTSTAPPPGRVRGPAVEGDWPAAEPSVTFDRPVQAAVRLAVALRRLPMAGGPAALAALKAHNEQHPNMLVRQLARAVRPSSSSQQG